MAHTIARPVAGREREFVERIAELPLKEFEIHGHVGKRRAIPEAVRRAG
jgi:hypothetical protein